MGPCIGRVRGRLVCALVCLALLAATTAHALTFEVDSVLDEVDDDVLDGVCQTAADTCTLRAAVMQANRIGGPGVTILLPPGLYSLVRPVVGVSTEADGDLNLLTPASGNPLISIVGAGPTSTVIDANLLSRVMKIDSGRSVAISGVTLRNGVPAAFEGSVGGGIWSAGTLVLQGCVLSGHQSLVGGAIYQSGTSMTIEDSVFRSNRATGSGGALYAGLGTILNTTFEDNQSDGDGGAIRIPGGLLTLVASTLSGNFAAGDGGAISIAEFGGLTASSSTLTQNAANGSGGGVLNEGVVNIYSSTIAFNEADAAADPSGGTGGGVYNDVNGTFNLRNTILAGNYVSDAPIYVECTGTLSSYAANIVGLAGEDPSCTVDVVTGVVGTLNSSATLGPLKGNGGPTKTHALLAGSSAIDAGDPVSGCLDGAGPLLTDQRGAARVVGVRCDLGAFEYGAIVAEIFADGFEDGTDSKWSSSSSGPTSTVERLSPTM